LRDFARALVFALLAAGAACGDTALRPITHTDAGTGIGPCTVCADFPEKPIVIQPASGTPIPANIATMFGAPGTGLATGGPCLIEPQVGSLFPKNWLRPRFRWKPPPAGTVVELRLHIDVEKNDLVVYTTADSWTMDAPLWRSLSRNAADHDIAVSVRSLDRAAAAAAPAQGTHGTFAIAPVDAPGSIVYWAIKSHGETALNGFQIGEESTIEAIAPAPGRCVGCHSSTPDGAYVAFSDADTGDGQFASLALRSGRDGTEPPFLTASGRTLLARRNQHLAAFSPGHWKTGDHVALSLLNLHIVWTDLEATSTDMGVGWGPLTLDGDPGPVAGGPSWSHDGTFVVYASGRGTNNGGLLFGADIYRVPYADHAGGTAVPVAGASDLTWNEFYPTLSPDDQLMAFSRAPNDAHDSYNNAQSEVFVVPARGGVATRVAANDPCPCLGNHSPGVTNSWPKWAPDATVTGGKVYYWLAFSSTRGESGRPQIFVTPIVRVDSLGSVVTYPALYLWNQAPGEGNHTPAWDRFQIPPVVVQAQ
jgi:hypothetical protein